jgi:hypothetical protein
MTDNEKLLESALEIACTIILEAYSHSTEWKMENFKAHCLQKAKEKIENESDINRK